MDNTAQTQKTAFNMNILRKRIFTENGFFNVQYVLLALAAASLPLTNWLMFPLAIAMLLVWLIEWNWQEKWNHLKKNVSPIAIIILFSIYLIIIYGFFLSYNKSRALAAFDCYLWFLTSPLVLLTYSKRELSRERIQRLLRIFALFTFIHIVILFLIATKKYIATGKSIFFYYDKLSILRHPSYAAMYATFAFFSLLDYIHHHRTSIPTARKWTSLFMMAVLATGIFFLQSKAGILVFSLLSFLWITYFWIIKKANILLGFCILTGILGTGIVLYKSDVLPMHRFKDTVNDVARYKNPGDQRGSGSSEIRLTVWRSTLEICKHNLPWGVGTGDATDELNVHAVKKNYTNLIGHHYNAHNQYLQTLLTTGILGLAVLFAYCILPLVTSLRRKDILYFSFAIILVLNILVESMFEVRAGVDFFALTNVLLIMRTKD